MKTSPDAEAEETLESHLARQARDLAWMESFFWHRVRSDLALRSIRRHAGNRATVLDLGAGAGVFGSHFTRAFPQGRYTFVEPVAPMAQELRRRFGKEADLSGKDYSAVQAVVLLDVLEHQERDLDFLLDLGGRLRPGTLVVATCPALSCLWSDWDVKLGHFRRYTRGTFREVLGRAGMKILDLRYLFPSMVLPGLLRRRKAGAGTEFPKLPAAVNAMLYGVARLEHALLPGVPFGSSIAAVVRTKSR